MRVLEWTNVTTGGGDLAFPRKTTMERVYYSGEGGGGSPKLAETMLAEVTSLNLGAFSRELPPLESEAFVSDFRFRSPDLPWLYVGYTITNRQWVTTNDPNLLASLVQYRSNYAGLRVATKNRAAGTPTARRGIVRIVVMAVFVLPLLVLSSWALRSLRIKHPQTRMN